MTGAQRRKGTKGKNKTYHRGIKTRHYMRDHDQIHEDLANKQKFSQLEVDQSRPGSGQFYCVSCSRYFESQETCNVHKQTKKHKRMLKKMQQKPYSHKQAQQAGK